MRWGLVSKPILVSFLGALIKSLMKNRGERTELVYSCSLWSIIGGESRWQEFEAPYCIHSQDVR